ncbi:MAG: phosphate ABC transporter substrate-binding protein PstS family protein [Acetanaerobacterium sp.]
MKKALSVLLVLMMTAAVFTGCATDASAPSSAPAKSEAPASEAPSEEPTETALSGKVSLTGSSSMQDLMESLIEAFKEVEPGVTVECQYPGSGQGMTSAADGTVDIGNASRGLKDEEAAVLDGNIVAIDGVAVVINSGNAAEELTTEEVVKIFTGEIKNWNEVGGADAPIVVIGRDAVSGTREAFQSVLKIEEPAYSQEIPTTGGVKSLVASSPDSIGYISLDAVDDTVKAVKVDGVVPSADTIVSGDYKLSRPFVMATNKSKTLSAQAQAFLDFALGADGKAIAKDLGLVVS